MTLTNHPTWPPTWSGRWQWSLSGDREIQGQKPVRGWEQHWGVETTYEPGLYVVNERSIVPLNFTDKTQIQDDDDRVLNYVRG